LCIIGCEGKITLIGGDAGLFSGVEGFLCGFGCVLGGFECVEVCFDKVFIVWGLLKDLVGLNCGVGGDFAVGVGGSC